MHDDKHQIKDHHHSGPTGAYRRRLSGLHPRHQGAAQHLPSPLSGRDGGLASRPPDDLEGDFLAEFKEDPTSYFGYTEALGVELAETTAHLWAEFFPGKTPGPYDEKRTFFQIMVQSQNEDGGVVHVIPGGKQGAAGLCL